MHKQHAPMWAAIDIGSNTIHVVVARSKPDDLDIVADEVELVRIGESVNASGKISPEKRDTAIATLRQYKELAQQHGATEILAVATEAIRKASNSAKFLQDVRRETGLQVHLIDGDVEAVLTFYGATYKLLKESGAPAQLSVMDLGGGSTELVMAQNMHISWHTSIPIGSGWLRDRYLSSNPPTPDDLATAETFLRTYLQGMRIKQHPASLIVTGGSANSLLLLAQQAFRLDTSANRLSYEDLLRCEGLLGALSAEEISRRYEQPLARARILPAGALIIREVMLRLNLREITINPHGIREGALLGYARYGENWLKRVGQEASVSSRSTNSTIKHSALQNDAQHETFARSGQRMLAERVEKLLDWHDEVLKHEDIEAVHKMRVATRRLRATLDAFESCCQPQKFKKIYRLVKDMADLLGAARDTDVMLQGLHEKYEQVPVEEKAGVQWLIDRLEIYRRQKQQELEDYFAALDEAALKQQVESCIRKGALRNGQS